MSETLNKLAGDIAERPYYKNTWRVLLRNALQLVTSFTFLIVPAAASSQTQVPSVGPSSAAASTWERRQYKTTQHGQGKHSRSVYVPKLKATLISGGDRATAGISTQNYNNEWLKLSFNPVTLEPKLETYLGYWEVPANKMRPFHPDQQMNILLPNGNVFAPAGWTPEAPPSPFAADEWQKRGLVPIDDKAWELDPLTKTFTPRTTFPYIDGIAYSRGTHNKLKGEILYAVDQKLRIQKLSDGSSRDIGIVSSGMSMKAAVWIPGTNKYQVYGWVRTKGEKSPAQVWLFDADTNAFQHKHTFDFHMYSDSMPTEIPGLGALLFSGDVTTMGLVQPNANQYAQDSVIVGWDFTVHSGPPKPVLADATSANPSNGQKFKPNLVGYDELTDQVWARYTVAVDYKANSHILAVYKVPRGAAPPPPPPSLPPADEPPVEEPPVVEPEEPSIPPVVVPPVQAGQIYELNNSDIANTVSKQPLINAGILNPDGSMGAFKSLDQLFYYSGMAKRGQRVYFFGSGGAGAFGGNSVVWYDLLTQQTGYEVLPSNQVHIYKKGRKHTTGPYAGRSDDTDFAALLSTEKHYNRDGTPAAPHAYRQFHNILGTLTQIGSANIFYNDSGIANVVNKIVNGKWVRSTPMIAHSTSDDHLVVVDERNGYAYVGARDGIYRRYPDGKSDKFHSDSNYQHLLAPAGIDPIHNVLVRMSEYPNYGYNGTKESGELVTYDLATGKRTIAKIIGDTQVLDMFGSTSQTPAYMRKASPMEWIPEWNAFGVLLPDDTFYSLKMVDAKTWELKARYGNTGLVQLAQGQGTLNAYWSRAKYSPELGGMVFFGNPTLRAKVLVTKGTK
ncbi:MAG TPA: hypothetical protein VJU83_11330 [Burkholderiales bacterium]|nr:hypothetical protein [Burkholderiales bacterium]